jgi:hypothetical protein
MFVSDVDDPRREGGNRWNNAVSRSQIGRWIGVAAGAIMAISSIWWMPYYPIWSLTYIGIGVFVIYALAAHGEREEVTT